MSASDGRTRLAVAALVLVAGCDDPLRLREAPPAGRLSVFALIDPDRSTLPVFVQQEPGQWLSLDGMLRTGSLLLARVDVPAPSTPSDMGGEQQLCFTRYAGRARSRSLWTPRCLEFEVAPEFGTSYEVSIGAPGLSQARGTTTVPGDFEFLAHRVELRASGDVAVDAVWRSSAHVHRYLVTVVGAQVGMPIRCHPDSLCHERWYALTSDTSLSVVIPARHFEDSEPAFTPYALVVHALSPELYGYMFTGTTSDFFPVPPAQNVAGGFGAVASWVTRGVLTDRGVTLERVRGGFRITNGSAAAVDVRLVANTLFPFPAPCSGSDRPGCVALSSGQQVFIADTDIETFGKFTHTLFLELGRGTGLVYHAIHFF